MKKSLSIGIIFLFILSALAPMTGGYYLKISDIKQPSIIGHGKTLYVGGSGPGNYTKIQDAIDNASDDDTVFVYDDSSPYYENIIVDKSISLIGEDKVTTVIDGDYKGAVVDIQADGVTVSGFTLINCNRINNWQYNVIKIIRHNNVIIKNNIISIGPWDLFPPWVAGVYLKDSSNNLIQNNIIFDDSDAVPTAGIEIYDGSSLNNVSGNEIYGYTEGLGLDANDNIIYGNNIHHNSYGIDNHGDSNKIINNIVTNNLCEGIRNDRVSNILISGNTITYNGHGIEFDRGISLIESSNNQIINNYISNNNPTGIYLLISKNNLITDNRISDNKLGVYADFSYKNTISGNNFIGNNRNAYFDSEYFLIYRNIWDKNYWSDYKIGRFYLIVGTVYFIGFIFFSLPWFQIDWNPAKEPYDIGI